MSIPYANATSGEAARAEITRILRSIGCDRIGFMDEFATSTLILAFEHRGRPITLRASAKGWAAWFLRAEPWTNRKRVTAAAYERQALQQGMVAINSILRDWVKGSVTAVECGVMTADALFLAHFTTGDGRTVIEVVAENNLLPPPRST